MWKILDVFVSLVLSIVACACEQNGSKELYIFVIISLHCLTSLERKKVDRTLTPRWSETLNTIWEKSWFWYFSPQESRICLTEIDFVRRVSCEKLRKCQKKGREWKLSLKVERNGEVQLNSWRFMEGSLLLVLSHATVFMPFKTNIHPDQCS